MGAGCGVKVPALHQTIPALVLVWRFRRNAPGAAFVYACDTTLTTANRLVGVGLALLTCLLVPFLASYFGIVIYIGHHALNWAAGDWQSCFDLLKYYHIIL